MGNSHRYDFAVPVVENTRITRVSSSLNEFCNAIELTVRYYLESGVIQTVKEKGGKSTVWPCQSTLACVHLGRKQCYSNECFDHVAGQFCKGKG